MIKGQRIRTIQQTDEQKIEDGVDVELIGIINYALIALIQLALSDQSSLDMPYEDVASLYTEQSVLPKPSKMPKIVIMEKHGGICV